MQKVAREKGKQATDFEQRMTTIQFDTHTKVNSTKILNSDSLIKTLFLSSSKCLTTKAIFQP